MAGAGEQGPVGGHAMEGKGWAVDRLLAVMDRRARLLGLDRPAKHEVLTIDAIDHEIARLMAQFGQVDRAPGG